MSVAAQQVVIDARAFAPVAAPRVLSRSCPHDPADRRGDTVHVTNHITVAGLQDAAVVAANADRYARSRRPIDAREH